MGCFKLILLLVLIWGALGMFLGFKMVETDYHVKRISVKCESDS